MYVSRVLKKNGPNSTHTSQIAAAKYFVYILIEPAFVGWLLCDVLAHALCSNSDG